MVDPLDIGPYSQRVVSLFAGPLLEVAGEGAALARLINVAAELETPELTQVIAEGREWSNTVSSVRPPTDAVEDHALREAWAARTGEELGEGEVARVWMMGEGEPLAVSWKVLRDGVIALSTMRANWQPDPGPWLFIRPTKAPFVTPQDLEIVDLLEEEGKAIDGLDLESEVGREPDILLARRRRFLGACSDAGVFTENQGSVRDQWLHLWSVARLQALRRAAKLLRVWGLLTSDEDPLHGRVCLDYVRLELWPAGGDGETWARSALQLLTRTPEGDQGVVVDRAGELEIRVWWRRDGDSPALLAVERE